MTRARARTRRSFVRLAIKNGTPLVPVFYFGASRTLSKFSPAWLEQVSRKLKISLLGFYGRWYVPVPYARPIKMAVGRAIEVRASVRPWPLIKPPYPPRGHDPPPPTP